jgi:hypothetical protein
MPCCIRVFFKELIEGALDVRRDGAVRKAHARAQQRIGHTHEADTSHVVGDADEGRETTSTLTFTLTSTGTLTATGDVNGTHSR